MAVPLVDVKAQYAPLLHELAERLADVLESGRFILGPNVREFEREAADFLGAGHAVGVANGTDAIELVLDALGIGPGDEVIAPAFTFYATVEPVLRRGAVPVFCDIDPATLNLDPEDVAARVTPRTRAVIAVHLFGRPAPLERLPPGIPVIEDAAQAFGAPSRFGPSAAREAEPGARSDAPPSRVGSIGVAGTFSFFPTKNLFGLGDGGLVTTNDGEIAERVRALRFHGSRDGKETFDLVGYNSRLDELQAAALRLFLPHVDRWNERRRAAAARYAELDLGELCELPEDEPGHVYHMYVVRTPERDRLREALRSAAIEAKPYYARPLHLQPALAHLGYAEGALPETERAAAENLALPLWPAIELAQQEDVVATVREAAGVRA